MGKYDAQSGFHTLGKLICSGKKFPEEKPSSCSSLKKAGVFHSAYYNVKEDGQFSKLVYCNMSTPGYQNTGEELIESSESHFVEMEETIDEISLKVEDITNPMIFSAIKTSGSYYEGSYIDSFDKFLVDDGTGFDLDSGTFKAPTSGVFEFSATLEYYIYDSYRYSKIAVLKNLVTELVFREYAEDNNNVNTGRLSFTWMLELKEGDEVRLKTIFGRFRCWTGSVCTFNGKFIRGI